MKLVAKTIEHMNNNYFSEHTLLLKNKRGFIVISEDVNTSFCYVDVNDNKIKEPIYNATYFTHKRNRIFRVLSENLRESDAREVTLNDKLNLLIDEFENKRRERLINEFKYRRKIQAIEPINYLFNGDVMLTMVTECVYYSAGILSKRVGEFYPTKKLLVFYLNGKIFHNNTQVVDVDFYPSESYLVSVFQNIQTVLSHYAEINVSKFKTVKINLSPLPKMLMIGQTFNINGELLTIIDSNIGSNHSSETERFTVKYAGSTKRDTISLPKLSLTAENITQLCETTDAMTLLITSMNKLKFC